MPNPFFSIVIPTYNRAHTIGAAIESCLAQTVQDFEIIVIDDSKSTDNIAQAIAPYTSLCDIRLILDHQGRAASARNTGANLATGSFVAFLDADDAWLPHKLEVCRSRVESEPRTLYYSQNYVDRGVGKFWIKPARGLEPGEDIFEYLFYHKGWLHPSSIVVAGDLIKRIPFREDLSFGDDTQLAVDFSQQGIALKMIDEPLTIYHDPYEAGRLSQTPVFERKNTTDHTSFIHWAESHKENMSQKAWLSYRAYFYSRFIVGVAPWKSLTEIWRAYSHGVIGMKKCMGQMVQTFTPGMYRKMVDQMVRFKGLSDIEPKQQFDHNNVTVTTLPQEAEIFKKAG